MQKRRGDLYAGNNDFIDGYDFAGYAVSCYFSRESQTLLDICHVAFVALRLLVPVNIGTFSFGVSGMMNQVQDHTENTKEIETDKMQEGSLNTLVLHKNTTTNSKMTVPEEKEIPAQISAQEKMQEAWKAYKDKIWLAWYM